MKPTKLFSAEHSVIVWHYTVPEGVSPDDLVTPEFWTHVAGQLRQGHRIEVSAIDGTWWGMLYVRHASKGEARVQFLQRVDLGDVEALPSAESPFEAKWRGPQVRWSVIRKSDGEVIKEHLPEKADALRYIANKLRLAA